MYRKAFLFNGIGSKPEKLTVKLPPELTDRFMHYRSEAFGRLGLHTEPENNAPFDRKVAEWIISLICDRVVFEYYTGKGIIPDIGAGYSSGIVSISGCFGAVSHECAQDIIMMNRATMRCIEEKGAGLDMGAVIGFSHSELSGLLRERFTEEELVIGSGNSSFHTMICGQAEAVEKALELCRREGALKAFSLDTGLAYHHPVMKEYSKEYIAFCTAAEYSAPAYPVLSVFDRGIMTEGNRIMKENQLNVYTPIRWDLAMKKLEELGVTEFFDVSADSAVSRFSRVSRNCRIYTLEDV